MIGQDGYVYCSWCVSSLANGEFLVGIDRNVPKEDTFSNQHHAKMVAILREKDCDLGIDIS